MIDYSNSGSTAVKQEYPPGSTSGDGLPNTPTHAPNSFVNGNSTTCTAHNPIQEFPRTTEAKTEAVDDSISLDEKNINQIPSPKSSPGGGTIPLMNAADLIHIHFLLSLQRLNEAAQEKWEKAYEMYALEMQRNSRLHPGTHPNIYPPGPPPRAYAEIYLPTPESLPSFPWRWNHPVGSCYVGNAATLLDFLNAVYRGETQYAVPNIDIRPLFDNRNRGF